jgi:proteasome lid subunit RPN8/RPN11
MVSMMFLKEIKNIDLPDSVMKALHSLALSGMPNEVCGVIHKHNIIHQYPNTFCGDHRLGFDMEIDIHDDTIKAVWHSHPGGLAAPSSDDVPCMEQLAAHGYSYPWIIVTSKSITQWTLQSEINSIAYFSLDADS